MKKICNANRGFGGRSLPEKIFLNVGKWRSFRSETAPKKKLGFLSPFISSKNSFKECMESATVMNNDWYDAYHKMLRFLFKLRVGGIPGPEAHH